MSIAAGSGRPGYSSSDLFYPTSVAVDPQGNLYVSDHYNHRVMLWEPGAFKGRLVAGGTGAGPGAAQLSFPGAIVLDGSGLLYISDTGNHRVVVWPQNGSASGMIAVANTLNASQTVDIFQMANGTWKEMAQPFPIYADDSGNIFSLDSTGKKRLFLVFTWIYW